MNRILESTKKFAADNSILQIAVGLSGGPDSCFLSYLLKESGIDIHALHCNFNLRGDESNRDRDFTVNFCNKLNIPLQIIEFDVKKFREENNGISIEMACRDLRHQWFREKQIELKADRIALGHNADDNIETFFLNALRGSGTTGLRGMEYDNGTIWRPLLYTHKRDIVTYLDAAGLDYITDSSNFSSDYRRNFLRNQIIPLLKTQWNGFDKALDSTISHVYEEHKIVETSINQILDESTNGLAVDKIINFPAPELLIRRFISPLLPFHTTAKEVLEAIKAKKPHIPIWILKNGILSLKKRKLFIEKKSDSTII